MLEILGNNMFFGADGGVIDAGKMNNLFFCVVNFSLIWYCAYYFRVVMLNKKKKNLESKTTSVPWIYVLMILVPLCRSLSLLLKVICSSPSLPLTIACNILSETPMLFLFVLICTGWPLVKPLLLLKDKLLLVGLVLMEFFLVPTFIIVAAHVKGKYTLNQYFEGFAMFRYALLFLSNKSSTHYLKEKGISTSGQAYTSICYIEQLFHPLFEYCSSYWAVRAILACFSFSSVYDLCIKELSFMVLCGFFANKFIPKLLDNDDLLLDGNDDDVVDLLLNHDNVVDDNEIPAIKDLAGY